MRALRLFRFGEPPALTDYDAASPGPGEVAVRIRAAALNFADLLMVAGQYQDIPPLPITLGLELAGVVEAVGEGVTGLDLGDRVAVYSGQGGLAESGVFPAERAVKIPDAMPFEDAAAFQIAYGTSHLALTERARLAEGETLLVLGASGGVGLTAVELGARMGARVIAVARGAERLAVAERAGAHHLIDSAATADLAQALKDLGGVDVVYDAVGGDAFRAALKATRPGGRLLVIGFASGAVPEIRANHLLVKNVDVIGFYWGGYLAFAPEKLRASLETLFDWYAAGGLRPQISHVLPLERAADGLELLRGRRATGKVVITP